MKMTNIDFFEFVYLWMYLQGLGVPAHQRKIARWLSRLWTSPVGRRGLLMAFRNSGKSTLVGLFCAWVLYRSPETRILVMAADYALAKKMVRNVKRIIERHPLTAGLKPEKAEQWASDQFTVNRPVEQRDPSMLAKGLGANITGLRADLIICDDVEVPKTCDTALKRVELRSRLDELDYIVTPGGIQLYIGTPHSFYTIYQTEPDVAKPETAPYLQGFECLKLPLLDRLGHSAWPERFDEDKISSIRIRSGENKFRSQMLLEPVNMIDARLNPERLDPYGEEAELTFSNRKAILKIGTERMVSASCWWDPAFAVGNKGDNSVVACVFTDEKGRRWLHDLEYLRIESAAVENAATLQCELVADFICRNRLPSIRVEANGIGRFLPGLLRQVLRRRKLRTAVLEQYSTKAKSERIVEAFEVLLAERALKAHRRIWMTPFIQEMREWTFDGSLHDDALDAVAGCLLSEPVRLPVLPVSGSEENVSWQGASLQYTAASGFEI